MYTLDDKFNIELHKKTFINYLEVIINEDGSVEYAIPSHQEFLIKKCMKVLNCSREDLMDQCPPEYYCDVLVWLCRISGCVSVWNSYIVCYNINKDQLCTLRQLRGEGLYLGDLPDYPVIH